MALHSRFRSLLLTGLTRPPRQARVHTHATLTDPAWSVFTDLRYSACVTVDHLDRLGTTAELLHKCGVHMGLVTDARGDIVGMVSAEALRGERPLQRASAARIHHDELTLEDLMAPLSDWAVVDVEELTHARVGDIAQTLHATGQRYLFVTEHIDGECVLRGLFSARRIESALQAHLPEDGHAHTFAELESMLAR